MATNEPNGSANPSAIVPTAAGEGRAIAAFASQSNFEAAQRMAKALASSTLVPAAYQNNLPNVLIAMEMAARIGASVFMVMQSLDIIHGRPSWRAQFLIGTVNASQRFTPLRFQWQGKEGTDEWGCRAVAKDRETNEPCVGPLVTIKTAKDEGWYQKAGSKWKTLPELMLMYRSGGFWTRVYCPEISLGLVTSEEIIDTTGYSVAEVATPASIQPGSAKALEAELLGQTPVAPASSPEHVNETTGEVTSEPAKDVKKNGKAVPPQKPAEPTKPQPPAATGEVAPDAYPGPREPGED